MGINIREFERLHEGCYMVPVYKVEETGIVQSRKDMIQMVKGSKERGHIQVGTLDGHLLAVCLDHLTEVNGKIPSEETTEAIAHIEKAIQCLEARNKDRADRKVQGTDQK